MKESDQLATSFITPYGSYCYVTIPFGLKNASATYQRCMQRCFTDQIDSPDQPNQVERPKPTISVYVDDIVEKMAQASDLIANLAATSVNLKRFIVKLNPEKCVFGVPKGKLLGYIMFERGVEANLKKIMAISNMGPICNVKGIQRLTGYLAGRPELVHLLARRARDASLQATQKDRHICLD